MNRKNQERLLQSFLAHQYSPLQRSDEWFSQRKTRIGSSEMAALSGTNPYTSFHELVARKAGLKPFSYPLACQWGTLFETIVEAYVEKDCVTKLFGSSKSILPVFFVAFVEKKNTFPALMGMGSLPFFGTKKKNKTIIITIIITMDPFDR